MKKLNGYIEFDGKASADISSVMSEEQLDILDKLSQEKQELTCLCKAHERKAKQCKEQIAEKDKELTEIISKVNREHGCTSVHFDTGSLRGKFSLKETTTSARWLKNDIETFDRKVLGNALDKLTIDDIKASKFAYSNPAVLALLSEKRLIEPKNRETITTLAIEIVPNG